MKTPNTPKGMGYAFALAAMVSMATPAFAQFVPTYYKSNVQLSCKPDEQTADGSRLLPMQRTGNRELIALCNGLDPENSADKPAINDAVEAQIVVFDAVDHRVLVIDRCSPEPICAWHYGPQHDDACSLARTGTPEQGTRSSYCASEIGDVEDPDQMPLANIHGTAWCKEQESWNRVGGANEQSFSNSCHGYLGLYDALDAHDFGMPCQVEVTSARQYVFPDSCNQ